MHITVQSSPAIPLIVLFYAARVLWVGVVDSHIQRVILASEETTATQQVSHRPIKYQSRSLVVTKRYQGQRVTSWCDNPLLRPTEIQTATKSMQGPTNRKHRKRIVLYVYLLLILILTLISSINMQQESLPPSQLFSSHLIFFLLPKWIMDRIKLEILHTCSFF